MATVHVRCTESRMVADDRYAEGEEYVMDAKRAAKYHAYFEVLPDAPKQQPRVTVEEVPSEPERAEGKVRS